MRRDAADGFAHALAIAVIDELHRAVSVLEAGQHPGRHDCNRRSRTGERQKVQVGPPSVGE